MTATTTLTLPEWATQDGRIIRVQTVAAALRVMDYIPEDRDSEFDIVITDRAQMHAMTKLARALR